MSKAVAPQRSNHEIDKPELDTRHPLILDVRSLRSLLDSKQNCRTFEETEECIKNYDKVIGEISDKLDARLCEVVETPAKQQDSEEDDFLAFSDDEESQPKRSKEYIERQSNIDQLQRLLDSLESFNTSYRNVVKKFHSDICREKARSVEYVDGVFQMIDANREQFVSFLGDEGLSKVGNLLLFLSEQRDDRLTQQLKTYSTNKNKQNNTNNNLQATYNLITVLQNENEKSVSALTTRATGIIEGGFDELLYSCVEELVKLFDKFVIDLCGLASDLALFVIRCVEHLPMKTKEILSMSDGGQDVRAQTWHRRTEVFRKAQQKMGSDMMKKLDDQIYRRLGDFKK